MVERFYDRTHQSELEERLDKLCNRMDSLQHLGDDKCLVMFQGTQVGWVVRTRKLDIIMGIQVDSLSKLVKYCNVNNLTVINKDCLVDEYSNQLKN